MEEKKIITFMGDRHTWIDFMAKVKKEGKTAWQALKPMLKEYTKKGDKHGRI